MTTPRTSTASPWRLFDHLLALPMSYFASRPTGQSVARVRELDNIRDFLTSSALTLVLDLFFTCVFFAVMWYFSLMLTMIVLASLPFYAVISLCVTPVLRARLEEQFQRGAANQAFLVETVTGVETVKAMAVEPQLQLRLSRSPDRARFADRCLPCWSAWEEQLAAHVTAGFRAKTTGLVGSQAIQLTNKITMIAVLYFGAQGVLSGELTIGMLVAFNMLAGLGSSSAKRGSPADEVSQPVLRLAQLWQDFQQARISVQRLGDILNTPRESSAQVARSAVAPEIVGRITLDNVSFRYRPDGQKILDGLSLDIQPGECIGIMGVYVAGTHCRLRQWDGGSGKSTITKLIQRLYLPESGRVMIDGIDIAHIDPAWLRRQIGVVLQDNILFTRPWTRKRPLLQHSPVRQRTGGRENIALADPAMPMERVIEAAKLAGAHDFISQLSHGYDTVVEERGSSLSGGQRQRIAIARALVGDPRILIFDEATSALDPETEQVIHANMKGICHGRTVVIIAHRETAVRECGRVVRL